MRTVIIDNYDSFTYNLAHLVRETGVEVTVVRNDRFTIPDLQVFDNIILSPGPGIPEEAGLMPQAIKAYAQSKPMLGVCLGHQAIGEAFGARLRNLSEVFHGVQTEGTQLENDPIFAGLPSRIAMGRYHSWVVDRESMTEELVVTAETDDGLVMALRHCSLPVHGIQFHPESVLTPQGRTIVENWLKLSHSY